jgi:hypothetical protein
MCFIPKKTLMIRKSIKKASNLKIEKTRNKKFKNKKNEIKINTSDSISNSSFG